MNPPVGAVQEQSPRSHAHIVSVSSAPATARLDPQQSRPHNHLRLVTAVSKRRTSPVLLVAVGAAIVALFGLAAFHNLMASAQYDLEKVELELDLEQARLVDLGFQIQQLNSPRKVEQLARGALGMIDPVDPVDLDVEAALLAEVNTAHSSLASGTNLATDGSMLKSLLGDS